MLNYGKNYPEVDRKTKEPISDYFRLIFTTKNGPKTKLLITMTACALPELENFIDLEYEMGGPPASVEMGLYWYRTDPNNPESPWSRVDDTAPVFFRDMTDQYYKKIRPRMYPKVFQTDEAGQIVIDEKTKSPIVEEDPDPYKDVPRPTRATGLEAEIERLKRELQQKQSVEAQLRKQIEWIETSKR